MSTTTEKFEYLKSRFDYIPRKPIDDIMTKPCFIIDGCFNYPKDGEYEWDWIERLFEEEMDFNKKMNELLDKKYENL